MAKLIAARTAQYPLAADFTFSVANTMLNVAGALDGFATVVAHVFDVIPLPVGAVVIGGSVVTETAVAGSTAYNVKVGDASNDARFLGTTDKTAVGATPLVPTGLVGNGENIRITVTPTVADATAGKITVRVTYTVAGRANESAIV